MQIDLLLTYKIKSHNNNITIFPTFKNQTTEHTKDRK